MTLKLNVKIFYLPQVFSTASGDGQIVEEIDDRN
jgi:hypothetical protein